MQNHFVTELPETIHYASRIALGFKKMPTKPARPSTGPGAGRTLQSISDAEILAYREKGWSQLLLADALDVGRHIIRYRYRYRLLREKGLIK